MIGRVNLFEGITPATESQFGFFNQYQLASIFIFIYVHSFQTTELTDTLQDVVNYLKNLSDRRGFILKPSGSGKSTLIKVVINVFLDIHQLQILVCCLSNDATNSVCYNIHDTYFNKDVIRLYAFAMELQHVKDLALLYSAQQHSEQIS